MQLEEFLRRLEERLPPGAAFPEDKIGLQVGDPAMHVRGVYLTLDVEVEDIAAARAADTNLILAHHPVIHEAMTHLRAGSRPSDVARALLSAGMAAYVAHTNFDNSPFGMARELARRLELPELTPLAPPPKAAAYKLAVFVPAAAREALLRAMSEAGAGRIGDYILCSFNAPGTGTFLGLEGTQPTVGESGRLEEAEEIRMEMVCPKNRLGAVVAAMLAAHPYEEPAYDVYPLEAVMARAQYVWKGRYASPIGLGELRRRVEEKICLGLPPRLVCPPGVSEATPVQTVGLCPGGGASALPEILAAGLDALVVGELGYHRQLECAHAGLPAILAGHAETERFFVPAMAELLTGLFDAHSLRVVKSERYPT